MDYFSKNTDTDIHKILIENKVMIKTKIEFALRVDWFYQTTR